MARTSKPQPLVKSIKRAGALALRDMKAEAIERVRTRLRLDQRQIVADLSSARPKQVTANGTSEWTLRVKQRTRWAHDYPFRQTPRGVQVFASPRRSRLLVGAFATRVTRAGGLGGSDVDSHGGHIGVFKRRGPDRLPIDQQLAPRPFSILFRERHAEGVLARGLTAFQLMLDRTGAAEILGRQGSTVVGDRA